MTTDERALLQRLHRLEEEAFGEAFDTYYTALYRYIYQRSGHKETAEDLAAEVFARLVTEISAGRGPDQYLRAWLYQVARNLVIDEMRSRGSRPQAPLDERLAADGMGPASIAEQAILGAQARGALSQLTPRQREVVILKYLQGLEHREIARILDTTPRNIRALCHRALEALRTQLALLGQMDRDEN